MPLALLRLFPLQTQPSGIYNVRLDGTELIFKRLIAMAPASTTYGPRPLILCGPSGTGKSTLIKLLMAEFKEKFGFSVSHTTRKPRPGEQDGREYHFVTKEVMERGVGDGEFVESATFSGNMYGTSRRAVEAVRRQGKICILDIDAQGVELIKTRTDLDPLLVFIKPPSLSVLEQRLRARSTETEESLQKRLQASKAELAYGESHDWLSLSYVSTEDASMCKMWRQRSEHSVFTDAIECVAGEEPGNFHIIIVNDKLEDAYQQLKNFLQPFINEMAD